MTEFTFPPLFADPLLVIYAQHRLRIYAERNFLCLNRLEQFGRLSPCSFRRGFFFLALGLFGIFSLLFRGFCRSSLRL